MWRLPTTTWSSTSKFRLNASSSSASRWAADRPVHIAAIRPVAALILQSPFVSVFRVLTRIPLLPFDKFPNYKNIAHVHRPVLIIHGAADSIIGVWHGQKLYDLANEPKSHFWVEGADHNDLETVAGA